MLKAILSVALALSVGGCGSSLVSLTIDPPGKTMGYFSKCLHENGFLLNAGDKTNVADVTSRLMAGIVPEQQWTGNPEATDVRQLAQTPGYVHLFLDCYVAHVGADDIERRLLRGQVVTTLLAQYASASLIAKARAAKPDDAATIIFHVRRASILLMSVSPDALESLYGLKDADLGIDRIQPAARTKLDGLIKLQLPNFRNAQRTAAIFDVGIDITRIDARAAANTAGTIFDVVSTTFATGGLNPSALPKLQGLVEAAVAGLTLAAESQWYGSAFIRDAQIALLVANLNDPEVAGTLWLVWQARINAACESLKSVADTRPKPCEPTAAEMADYVKREYPGHPYYNALVERAAVEMRNAKKK